MTILNLISTYCIYLSRYRKETHVSLILHHEESASPRRQNLDLLFFFAFSFNARRRLLSFPIAAVLHLHHLLLRSRGCLQCFTRRLIRKRVGANNAKLKLIVLLDHFIRRFERSLEVI